MLIVIASPTTLILTVYYLLDYYREFQSQHITLALGPME